MPPAPNPGPLPRIRKNQGDLRFRGGVHEVMDASDVPGAAATYSRRMFRP